MSRSEALVLAAGFIIFALPVIIVGVLMLIGYLGELPILPAPDWETLVTLRNAEITAIHLEQTLAEIEACQCPQEWIRILHSTSRR